MQQRSGKKREKKTIPLNGMHTFSTDFNAKEVWWKKNTRELCSKSKEAES
jgi:hypothetical protein